MSWAKPYIDRLNEGQTVKFRPRGNSMRPRIQSGDLCTVAPLASVREALRPGDVVLCRVSGAEYLHLILATQGDRFQIGNNRGHINGWVRASAIFGVLTKVEP